MIFYDLVFAASFKWQSVGIIKMIGTPRSAPETPRNWSRTLVNVIAKKQAKKHITALLKFFSHFLFGVFSGIFTNRKLSNILFVG